MKALNCPSCSAPIVLKKGLSRQKCAFCENELSLDFNEADEVKEIDPQIFEKYKKRTEDSLKRGFIKRYMEQWQTLSDYIGDDLSSQRSIDIRAKALSAKSCYFLWDEYDLKKGSTTRKLELEMEYANTLGASMEWTRLDHHYTDMLIQIEDYCAKLDDNTRSKFLKSYYSHYKEDMQEFVGNLYQHLMNNLSWTKDDEGNTHTWDGPVSLACALRFDAYAMLFKFFNDLSAFEIMPMEALELDENYNMFRTTDVKAAKRWVGDKPAKLAYRESVEDARSLYRHFEEGLKPVKAEAERLKQQAKEERLRAKINKFLDDPKNNHTYPKKHWPSTPSLLSSKNRLVRKFNRFAEDFEEAGKFNEALRVEFKSLVDSNIALMLNPRAVLAVAAICVFTPVSPLAIIFIIGYLIWLRQSKKTLNIKMAEIEQRVFDAV
jgi:hypothetical protein